MKPEYPLYFVPWTRYQSYGVGILAGLIIWKLKDMDFKLSKVCRGRWNLGHATFDLTVFTFLTSSHEATSLVSGLLASEAMTLQNKGMRLSMCCLLEIT